MSNYKYTFFDNQLIGVDQLNEITKRLVSGGISSVYSGADFNVSEINNSNMAILTGGVVPGNDMNLKVSAMGGGKYLINKGLCFFDDGTSMEVLSSGEEISVPSGSKRYVYLTSDKNQMKCYPEVLSEEKKSGQFVCLAIVNSDGSITDKRTYAKGKVPGFYASTENLQVNVSQEFSRADVTRSMTIEVPVGNGNFKHLLIEGTLNRYGSSALIYCEFENGIGVNPVSMSVEGGADSMYLYYNQYAGNLRITSDITLQNGKLTMAATGYLSRDTDVATINFHLW